MKTPRWITVVVGLVVVNGAFVTATVLHKHVWAQAGDDFAATESQPNDDTELPVLQAEGNSVGTTKTESESHYSGLTERAEPQLPEVPSLSDSELLESDPVFSEIKKMFSDSKFGLEGNSELAAPPSAPVEPSADYFRKLDSRLQTAMRLCESARAIAAEGEEMMGLGDRRGSQDLLGMAIQLREMAAELLVKEL